MYAVTICIIFFTAQLRIFWQGVEYPDGVIPITPDNLIGEFASTTDPGRSVVCNTAQVNTQCCRGRDGQNVGEWFFDTGNNMVPRRPSAPADALVVRTGFLQEVRLNLYAASTLTDQLGTYTCRVPSEDHSQTFEKTVTIGKCSLFFSLVVFSPLACPLQLMALQNQLRLQLNQPQPMRLN